MLRIVYQTWFMLLQFLMPWILFHWSFAVIDWEGIGVMDKLLTIKYP